MKYAKYTLLSGACALLAVSLLSGCATAPKKLEPIPAPAGKEGVLKEMDVAQQPELEAEWADFVKEHYPSWRRHYWVDRGNWGNRGYVVGHAPTEVEAPVPDAKITPLPPVPPAPPVIEEVPAPKVEETDKPTKYIVKKGDCLWKIAGKMYRNPLKWPTIYRANKDKIKNPNRIHVGQVLTIPQN